MDVQLYEGVTVLFKIIGSYNFSDNYNFYVHVPLILKTTVGRILILMLKPLQMDVDFFPFGLFFAIIRSYEVAIHFQRKIRFQSLLMIISSFFLIRASLRAPRLVHRIPTTSHRHMYWVTLPSKAYSNGKKSRCIFVSVLISDLNPGLQFINH